MIEIITFALGALFGWWLRWAAACYWNRMGWGGVKPLDKVGLRDE